MRTYFTKIDFFPMSFVRNTRSEAWHGSERAKYFGRGLQEGRDKLQFIKVMVIFDLTEGEKFSTTVFAQKVFFSWDNIPQRLNEIGVVVKTIFSETEDTYTHIATDKF